MYRVGPVCVCGVRVGKRKMRSNMVDVHTLPLLALLALVHVLQYERGEDGGGTVTIVITTAFTNIIALANDWSAVSSSVIIRRCPCISSIGISTSSFIYDGSHLLAFFSRASRTGIIAHSCRAIMHTLSGRRRFCLRRCRHPAGHCVCMHDVMHMMHAWAWIANYSRIVCPDPYTNTYVHNCRQTTCIRTYIYTCIRT